MKHFTEGNVDAIMELLDPSFKYESTSQPKHDGKWTKFTINRDQFPGFYAQFRELNKAIGASGDGDLDYIYDNLMITEWNEPSASPWSDLDTHDILLASVRLRVAGIFVSLSTKCFKEGKVMWDRLVNVPLDQGTPKGPPIGGLSDYEYKDNFKAILQQQEGFQTGDVPLIMEVQADSFAFAYAGRKYSKEQFLGAFKDIWLKDLVDGNTLTTPSLSVTTRVVYEWEGITFVTAEVVGPTHSGVHLSALKNGKFLWAKLELKPEANSQSEGPTPAPSKEPQKPSIELTDEQRAEVSSYLNEILNSTSTIEAQAKAKGQKWKNYGRQFYQELTGASDMEMQAKTWMDFAAWSPVPWTSDQEEPLPVMAAKARFLGMQTLQTQWNIQAPATHPTGVGVAGHAVILPEASQLPPIPFFSSNNIKVKARFSNVGGYGSDDRASAIRGVMINLHSDEEKLELHMNTGSTGVFENLPTFAMVAQANRAIEEGNIEAYKKWLYARPSHFYNLIEMTVRGPSSYTRLHFYSKFPILLTDTTGQEHFCKFRLVPAEDGPFDGLLTEEQQREIWNVAAAANDPRAPDYLRDELHHRIKEGTPTQFRVEVMTKTKTGRENALFFYPSADWKEPWRPMALVELTEALTTDQLRTISGNPHVLPKGMSILDPVNSFDPNWINWSRKEIYNLNHQIRAIRHSAYGPDQRDDDQENVKYKVVVSTGSMKSAGTDASISIVVVGDEGTTKSHTLDGWGDDFEAGDIQDYSFKDRHVGIIEFIILKLDDDNFLRHLQTGNANWFLKDIRVSIEDRGHSEEIFPHFQWVKDSKDPTQERPLILAGNKTLLPQQESSLRITARLLQSKQQELLASWSHMWPVGAKGELKDVKDSLPGFLLVKGITYGSLDPRFQWYEERFKEKRELMASLKRAGVLSVVLGFFDPINTVGEYRDITDRLADPTPEDAWMDEWDSDAEFGRQMLNGMNPTGLCRIKEIPENFPVKQEQVAGMLRRGLSLEEEVLAGNIYMVDYKLLDGISTGKYDGNQLVVPAAMGLFYQTPDDLVVLAIQLGQNPGPDCPIWTANDSREDWLLAKFWFKNADAQVGQVVQHLAFTHFVTEPFAMAMIRCLTPSHPVHKLMKEHMKFIFACNTLGRVVLFAPGGAIDSTLAIGHGSNGVLELITKAFQDFTYDDMNYVEDLKKRDVMDLPNFHHRDDSIKLWDTILEYVTEMVTNYYETDLDVLKDWELQSWVKDVFENGFGKMKGVKAPSLGFPSQLNSKAELVEYLQKLIFTDTVRHTFINFYTFQYSKFAPNSPMVMNGQLPTEAERGTTTLETLLKVLPNRKQATTQAATTRVLAAKAIDEIYLMDTPSWMFREEKAEATFKKFSQRLRGIEKEMVDRNKCLNVPYTVLLPSKMPAGISI